MFLDGCMSSTGKDLLHMSENAHASLPSNGHGLVGDVPRGVRISAHLYNRSLVIQALQRGATSLGMMSLLSQANRFNSAARRS